MLDGMAKLDSAEPRLWCWLTVQALSLVPAR